MTRTIFLQRALLLPYKSHSRAVAALKLPLARPKSSRLKVHVHVRVSRRARRVFALFPSDSTFISYRRQFARFFQKVFPPPHFFVKNTTTVFFFQYD